MLALRILVPGGHVFIASTPLLSDILSLAMRNAGFERRGEIIRTVSTLRGGDRPKGAEYPRKLLLKICDVGMQVHFVAKIKIRHFAI